MPRFEDTAGAASGGRQARSATRQRFVERLRSTLDEARGGGHRVALFLVGIDRSSGVLESLEPSAAESLATRVGERLVRCTGCDGEAARLRDGEFALLMSRCRSGSQVRDAAARMLGALRFPFQASIGIAMFPSDCVHPGSLIACATTALASARREGRHSYCFYVPFFALTSAASSSPDL